MERPNTVAGLVEKRRQLERDLKAAEKAARNIRIDLDHLDAAIRLFTEDAPRRLPGHKVAHRASKGEMRRHVLKALREAEGPLTSITIAEGYMAARGLSGDSTAVLIRKRVGACLNSLKHAGTVEEVPQEGLYKGWRLA
ncbi:hypothetical protein [Hyphococcus sp.]|uniref:hypothetical protein n=1 Tax=Hyphococcus sp. TaxID=2038636 RepID=UPI0035C6FF06